MKPIYLFKGFFILCALIFSTNFFQLIQTQPYSLDTLFQFCLALFCLWLSQTIREAAVVKSIQLKTAPKPTTIRHSHS